MKILFLLLFSYAKSDVYFYFDDGGEHDYFKKCEKVAPAKWNEVKNKLVGANKKNGFLGKFFEEGELTNTTEYYFSSAEKCNLNLKETSKSVAPH
jgi:hypothetical protein